MRSKWNGFLCGCLGIFMLTGQVWALPSELTTGAIVRAQWSQIETPEKKADSASFIRGQEYHHNVESPLLLSAFELPSLHAADADLSHPEPGSSLTHAIMQGTWFDSALMQLVPPQQLVQPFKKGRTRNPFVVLQR